MIYTLTMNPSLDYVTDVENFRMGMTNRTTGEKLFPGGKGLNVSTVLYNLGCETTALGFVAGFTGDEIERRMRETGVNCEFIRLEEGMSRINVKIRTVDGTEINGMGPQPEQKHLDMLLERLKTLTAGDTLVLAGSLPKSVPASFYAMITEQMHRQEVKTIADVSGKALQEVLVKRPFLVKPNRQELSELFDVEITSNEEVLSYAKQMKKLGAENVLESLGGDGALLLDETEQAHIQKAPRGKVINSVGAGDSMVAGFLYGLEAAKGKDFYHTAFLYGLAAGSASAFSRALAEKEEIEPLYQALCG